MPRKRDKDKGTQEQWGEGLRDLFLSSSEQPTTPEQFAKTFADEVTTKIHDALDTKVLPNEPTKQAMMDELIRRTRSLAYAVALRGTDSSKSTKQDDEGAIKEIGKWLFKVKGLRGPPAKKRDLFIEAYEMHLSGLKWPEVTSEICECGKSPHDPKCVGSIENGVMGLVTLLRKYEIGDVPPFDQERSKKIKEGIREQKAYENRRHLKRGKMS